MFKRNIIQNDLFEGIMGRSEFEVYQENISIEDRSSIVLISISEPDNDEYLHTVHKIGFHDVIQMKFWDIEETIGKYEPLSDEQGLELFNFIYKNKDKKFLIHCKAGQSRSAACGQAVECIVNFNSNIYDYRISHSNIGDYERYSPNTTVFDKIIKHSSN
jgi:predicted protein tyrosine phosphatase